MNELLAALIIACSNLAQPSTNGQAQHKVIKLKKQCIKRIVACVKDKRPGTAYQVIQSCAEEVY